MDEWTISSRTYAIDVGGGAVHAYIAIKDNNGQVIAEYHGFPYSRETGEYEGNNPLAFTPLSNFRLRPRRLLGESRMSREVAWVHEDEVFRGPRNQVEQIQSAIDVAMKEIDRQDIDYGGVHFLSESRNSNSVYGTLMRVANDEAQTIAAGQIAIPDRLLRDDMAFDNQSRSSWAPGIHRDLLPGGLPAPSKKKASPLFGNKS